MIDAALNPPIASMEGERKSLYDKEGLIRYILCACQDTSRRGGMRDKPSKYVCSLCFVCQSSFQVNFYAVSAYIAV